LISDSAGLSLIAVPVALFAYALAGYPIVLWILSRMAPPPRIWGDPADWPRVAILVPAYNEEASIGGTLESLLALDYPLDRREVVVMSDASSDRTDEIVRSFESRGVRLVRCRCGREERCRESHPATGHVRYRG
jgi:cellulose synthase/poly-beta-1,6-N-acetylglucosamine synthase-like glycosyltransferase